MSFEGFPLHAEYTFSEDRVLDENSVPEKFPGNSARDHLTWVILIVVEID